MFPSDIINEISKYCDNASISHFLAMNRKTWEKRENVFFYGMVKLSSTVKYPFARLKKVNTNDPSLVSKAINVTHLFLNGFNQPITPGDIPNSVTHLAFGHIFNQPAKHIPKTVTNLIFGCDFNQPLVEGDIPNSVTHLEFGTGFDKPLFKGVIPDSVKHLTFGDGFNQPIAEVVIPNSVTRLKFGYSFNQHITDGWIPNSVTHLNFGYKYNQPMNKGARPNSVTHLKFGCNFNQPINNGWLPNSVTCLDLMMTSFNQPIAEGIPNSVTHLLLGTSFNQSLVGLPPSVTRLSFTWDSYKQPIPKDSLSDSVFIDVIYRGESIKKFDKKMQKWVILPAYYHYEELYYPYVEPYF